jgi:hypothetical protein
MDLGTVPGSSAVRTTATSVALVQRTFSGTDDEVRYNPEKGIERHTFGLTRRTNREASKPRTTCIVPLPTHVLWDWKSPPCVMREVKLSSSFISSILPYLLVNTRKEQQTKLLNQTNLSRKGKSTKIGYQTWGWGFACECSYFLVGTFPN